MTLALIVIWPINRHVRNAHMTFATCVAFSPNERSIISGASDASAVLTQLPGNTGGALAWLLVLLALLVALLAVALGAYLHLAAAASPKPKSRVGIAALIAMLEQCLPYQLREVLAAAAGGGS